MSTLVFQTNKGPFTIQLDLERAPKTAGNFLMHAKQGNFNGTKFHRVAPGFVIQGGDTSPKGIRADRIEWEETGRKNKKYTLSMARSGNPDRKGDAGTASSQFFVNLKDNASLDSYKFPYVVFGEIVDGQEVIEAIGKMAPGGARDYDGPPSSPVTVDSVTVKE